MNMEFNIETIDAYSIAMYQGNPEEQKNANSFLIAWQNSPGAEMTAFQILQSPQTSIYSKNSSCAIIKNFILRRFYSNLDQNARNQFRDNALLCLAANFQNSLITTLMISVISLISLYEWPENWPSFPFEIYPQENDDQSLKSIFFINVFNELITQVLSSDLIDPNRRVFLISSISSIISQIFTIVIPSIGIENNNKDTFTKAMKLLINLLKISPIENFQNENVLNLILSAFHLNSENETYHIEWLKFADKLLLKHPGRVTLIPVFAKPILSVACQIDPQSAYLSHFLIRFITKYSTDLVLLGIKETNEANSNEMLQMLVKQYMMTFKSPLINTNEIYDIWYIWLDLFRSDTIDIPNEGQPPTTIQSPLFEMISFESIIDPILEMLLLSSIEGYVAQKVVFKATATLYELYPEKLNNIFLSSPPVPQICILMTLLWGSMSEEKEIEIATNFYSNILSNKTQLLSPEALFAMSFCIRFLNKNNEAQNSLSEILCNLLKEINLNFLEPISRVLNFLSEKLPSIFVNNDEILLNSLLPNMAFILRNSIEFSNGKNGIRIFKAVCRASMCSNEAKRNDIFMGLSTAVLEYLNAEQTILAGLRCLTGQPDNSPIFQFVIEKLLSLCPVIFDEQFEIPDVVNTFFIALSKAFVSLPFNSISNVFLQILDTLFQKPNLACQTFLLIEIMRQKYVEVEQLFPKLLNNLILPYLTNRFQNESQVKSIIDSESQASNENLVQLDSEYFSMIAQFLPQIFNVPQIAQSFLFGIRDMRLDVVKSSIASLTGIIDKIESLEGLISFLQTFRRGLLNSLFVALFDMLHSSSFSAHVKLLRFFFVKSMNITFKLAEKNQDNSIDMVLFEQEFCEEMCNVLNLNIEDPAIIQMLRDLFMRLKIEYLTKPFKDIVKEFLISSNRTTNDGIMKIEEQFEANKSSSLIQVEQPFVDE